MEAEKDDELPEFTDFASETADTKAWEPSAETQAQVKEVLKGILPLKLRPSDLMLEKYYDRGHQLYKAGRYQPAMSYFKVLSMARPKNPKYLMAVAACYQMLKEYSNAVDYYGLAAILDDKNPFPQYYISGCLVKMDQPIGALIALEMGILRCVDNPRYHSIHDRMKMMTQRIHNELMEKKAAGLPYISSELQA